MYYSLISSMQKLTDAEKFIIAAGITDSIQKSAIITLVDNLKTYGIWSKMKALYPFVGGTASSHKFNLKDPRDLDAAFRLTFNGGWTHNSNGALPNGTNAYADTFLIPSTTLSINNTHLSYYSKTNSTGNAEVEIGARISTGNSLTEYQSFIEIKTSNITYIGLHTNGNTFINYSDSDSRGYYLITRLSATNSNTFKNAVLKGSGTNSAGLPNKSIYIGAWTYNVNPASNYSSKQTAFASIGDGLTDTEASNFYTAVQAYQTSLSRQV